MASINIHSSDVREPIAVYQQGQTTWLRVSDQINIFVPPGPGALEAAQAMALAYNRHAFPAPVAIEQKDAA